MFVVTVLKIGHMGYNKIRIKNNLVFNSRVLGAVCHNALYSTYTYIRVYYTPMDFLWKFQEILLDVLVPRLTIVNCA